MPNPENTSSRRFFLKRGGSFLASTIALGSINQVAEVVSQLELASSTQRSNVTELASSVNKTQAAAIYPQKSETRYGWTKVGVEGGNYFLRYGGALLGIAALNDIHSQVIEQSYGQANTAYEGGSYYANGTGTEGPMQKFGDLYELVIGENFIPNIERFYAGVFSGVYGQDPSFGLCNGFSNREICKLRLWRSNTVEGIDFSVEDIKALMAVFHYGDSWVINSWKDADDNRRVFNSGKYLEAENRYEIGQPIFLHKMLEQWFGIGTGVVLDRSNVQGAVWTHPIESYAMTINRSFGRMSQVVVNLRGANYPEPGLPMTQPYRNFQIRYEIDENNVFENGRYLTNDVHVMRVWVPNPKVSFPCYIIRNNIFPPDAIELMRQIIQYTPKEMEAVYGVYDQKRTDYEIKQYQAAQAMGECQ